VKINTEVQMERIRELRQQMGVSQVKLAVMADMDPATLNRLEQGKGNPNLKTLERVAKALGVEVADFFPKARSSSPEPSLFNGDDEQPSVVVDGIVGLLERWHARRLKEVNDPASLHFRDPTSAALWVADAREEANDFCLFLSEWGQENLDAFRSVWDAVHLFGAGLVLDNPAIAGEMRLGEMADKPDELAARRMERATAAAEESARRLDELREAANG
jgi:transcriptional regulator with XRE-family HTH domain